MAVAYVVTCCCNPGPSSPAKTTSSSSSSAPPSFATTKGNNLRVGRRNYNGHRSKPISKDEAMKELTEVVDDDWQVTKIKPDNFTPRIAEKTEDYIRVEYESPIFGFVDDVEFWFPPGNKPIVQYRSASRSGFVDFNANKKRVKELRLALEKKGWASESNF
ncbi:hypothetical protein PR202_gb29623 [Eleusine coracana subsp. coracana]|uniref:Uncharacterized protein n=1 Tax=Eleusine coracana subsp. coracana TaxID=191504 RepID=A0AAV5G0H6_ELECO|nr:hypothetical protein PR202_gb29623 [Eleusine coracana subsp. coracana]